MNNKITGELNELKFQVAALTEGLIVSRPYGDSNKYDFIVDHNGILNRIQVKTATKVRENTYSIKLATYGNYDRGTKYTSKNIDFIVAYVPNKNDWYIFPIKDLEKFGNYITVGTRTSKRAAKFKGNWKLLKGEKL